MQRSIMPVLAIVTLSCVSVLAQPGRIRTVTVRKNVHMLMGKGGNIGISTGADGVLMIDSQYAEDSGKILAAIQKLSKNPVRFLINTHWHGDHTGGNENFFKSGATIIAHENVRRTMSRENLIKPFNRKVPPSPVAARPVITFKKDLTLNWNGDEIHVFHVKGAHTDGDSFVHFKKADVLHLGDVYFRKRYPFIDVGAGGNLSGIIDAASRALEIAKKDTKIIPGHGGLSNREELQHYHDTMKTIRDRVQALVKQGKTAQEVVASDVTKEYDDPWGKGFMKPAVWKRLVYEGMKRRMETGTK